MPLFEVKDGDLQHIRRVAAGADLYEKEIEDLLWSNLEAFTGEALFPIARQPRLVSGGIPDVVALDESGRVVVVEVKRDVDRGQLAQCLEYAGWARTTNLDELASLYHRGASAFFEEWQEFTESTTPVVVNPAPRLILVAHDFHGRTRSALDFLQENGLPISVLPVTIYEEDSGRRFIDIDAQHEPVPASTTPSSSGRSSPKHLTYNGRRVQVADLIDNGLLIAGDALVWNRPRLGKRYEAEVLQTGETKLVDGRTFATPSAAAMAAADLPAVDGWHAWGVVRLDGIELHQLRLQVVATEDASDSDDLEATE